MKLWIWVLAAVLYLIFALWYFNWKGPLSSEEIEKYVSRIEQNAAPSNTDIGVLRKFMEEDDGKEFLMLNLIRFHEGDVTHPESGEKMSAQALIESYIGPFVRALIARGGHPVIMSQKTGGIIDTWNTAGDENYQVVNMMRYRSRRDLLEIATNPKFGDSHKYKLAAIDGTTNFPTRTQASTYLKPSIWVPLLLILLASLAQNAAFFFELRNKS